MDNINLHVEPHVCMTWKEFIETKPPYSVALDGYVADSTIRNIRKVMANFDHHAKVDRLSTRSTAEQVYMEINLGLFDAFSCLGKPKMEIYVNDCDEDTILSIWLLQNHERVKAHSDLLINKLVFCNDKLDCTGGVYPLGDSDQLRKMAWIFKPYRDARKGGLISQMQSLEMEQVINNCLDRITQYASGDSGECVMDIAYSVIGGGEGWSLVKESGTSSRMLMFASGINAMVSVLEEGRYVIAKKSMWISFPLDEIFKELNRLEEENVWGGSNTIGGSLRQFKSKFSPTELENIINRILKEKA